MCSLAFLTHDLSSSEKCCHISASPGTKYNDDAQPDTMRETLQSAGSNKCIPTKSERGNNRRSLRKAGAKLATNSRQAIRVGLRHLMGPWQASSNAVGHAIECAKTRSQSHNFVIRLYDDA